MQQRRLTHEKNKQYIEIKQESINTNNNKISTIREKLVSIPDIEKLQSQLDDLEHKLKIFLEQKKIQKLKSRIDDNKSQYDNIYKDNKIRIDTRTKEIDDVLWEEYYKDDLKDVLQDYDSLLQDYKEYNKMMLSLAKIPDTEMVDTANEKIEKIKKQLQSIKISKTKLICPGCNVSLQYSTNNHSLKFCKSSKNCDVSEKELLQDLQKYEKMHVWKIKKDSIIESIEQLSSRRDLDELVEENIENYKSYKSYYDKCISLEKEKSSLLKEIDNDILKTLQKCIVKDEEKLSKLSAEDDEEIIDIDEENTRKHINNIINIIHGDVELTKKITELEEENNLLSQSIKKKLQDMSDNNDVYKEIKSVENTIVDLETTYDELLELQEKLDEYCSYQEKLDEITKLYNKQQQLEELEHTNKT